MGESRDVYRVLVGKPEGRPWRRWEVYIRALRKRDLGTIDWTELAEDRDR
jgi:hypothetical protein